MTIAVTGASGFLGTHVLRALAATQGDQDIVAISRRPIANLPTGVRHVALDLTVATPQDYLRMGSPDMLIHLAWDGLPNYLALRHFEIELPAQYRFLRTMVESGLPAMLVTGTCYEYGMANGPLSEDQEVQPTNPYGYAKAALCRQLRFLQTEIPFALTWARLFYMWGDNQAAGSLYPLLRAAVRRGETRFAMSQGEQLRDYLPVTAVADILISLARRAGDDGIVNVSSGVPISVRTLVERWIATEGWSIEPDLGRYPYPAYEPLAFWGSTAKRYTLLSDR